MNQNRRLATFAVLVLVALIVVACGGQTSEYDALLVALRGAGAEVEVIDDEFSQPFLSAPGRLVRIDGQDVQVFDYADAAAASGEAALVSPDGSSVGDSMISWMATPHFFHKGHLIVLYVGDDAGVFDALETALGPQIAGG